MNQTYADWLTQRMQDLSKQQLVRKVSTLESPQGSNVVVDGKTLINFSSNDYLSMANSPVVKQALIAGVEQYGVGSGASHLISGHSEAHERLQASIAAWTGFERVLLFSSGYMANLALLRALVDKPDLIVQDKLNHASLIDGAQFSSAKHKRFQHANIESLKQQLQGDFRFKWIVTDGVFSMDGDIAPLAEYSMVSRSIGANLLVDDAHGVGVLGDTGAGSLEYTGTTSKHVTALMGTFGKAIGTAGAFVATDALTAGVLTQFARTHIYTTALPPSLAFATEKSIQHIRENSERRQKLTDNIRYFKQLASEQSIDVLPSDSAIQPVVIGDAERCMNCASHLREKGIWVGAIRPPTVPKGTARLRLTLNTDHQRRDIEQLVEALAPEVNGQSM